jgi:GNAT superfamily N-acetyltransferase
LDNAHEPRRAAVDEVPALAEMVARAFYDDPVWTWMFPDDRRRLGQARRFFSVRARQIVPQGETYTTAEHAGIAAWSAPPDGWRLPLGEAAAQLLRLAPVFGRRLPTVLSGLQQIEEGHPHEPHFYLSVLGTEPRMRGRGIGSALMAPVLAQCDRDEIPAFLETTRERNVDFYARHGFQVTREIVLPRGPRMWLMWREPRP